VRDDLGVDPEELMSPHNTPEQPQSEAEEVDYEAVVNALERRTGHLARKLAQAEE